MSIIQQEFSRIIYAVNDSNSNLIACIRTHSMVGWTYRNDLATELRRLRKLKLKLIKVNQSLSLFTHVDDSYLIGPRNKIAEALQGTKDWEL